MKKLPLAFGLVTLAAALVLTPVTGAAGHPEQSSVNAVQLTGSGADGRDIGNTPDTSEVTNVTGVPRATFDEVARVRALIDPWCGEVPLTVRAGSGGEAGFTRSWHPVFARGGKITEYIRIGLFWPADHPATRAVALHECAHILQYRTYDYDWSALDRAMRQVYPDGPHSPIEHMADCMSEVMGAERRSIGQDGQGYDAGYGGSCSPAQLEAAEQVVGGRRL